MFEMILFGLVVLSGVIIFLCRHVIKAVPPGGTQAIYLSEHQNEAWYLDYARSFFPVLLLVFMLRGFIVEPFRIPSGSMLPTLEIGDFILVNKFSYGLRLPILHDKVIPIGDPKRGDIMVFRFPRDNKTHYIKRVIGLPGDEIEYRHKRLYINGNAYDAIPDGTYTPFAMNGHPRKINRYTQTIPDHDADNVEQVKNIGYSILLESRSATANRGNIVVPDYRKIIVPDGHYLMMGDNRDHSSDGRSWGFVPEENVVGKAFFIWFHWNSNPGGGFNFSRVGEDIYATM